MVNGYFENLRTYTIFILCTQMNRCKNISVVYSSIIYEAENLNACADVLKEIYSMLLVCNLMNLTEKDKVTFLWRQAFTIKEINNDIRSI